MNVPCMNSSLQGEFIIHYFIHNQPIKSQDKNFKLEKDLDPLVIEMQDIMKNIKKKKNNLYDKTTIEFVDVSKLHLMILVSDFYSISK